MQLFDLEKDPSEKENIIHDKRYEQEVAEVANDTEDKWKQVNIFMQ